jgi:hypothetical protein
MIPLCCAHRMKAFSPARGLIGGGARHVLPLLDDYINFHKDGTNAAITKKVFFLSSPFIPSSALTFRPLDKKWAYATKRPEELQ